MNQKSCYIPEIDGKCLGFSKTNDDEPIEMCKQCELCSAREED